MCFYVWKPAQNDSIVNLGRQSGISCVIFIFFITVMQNMDVTQVIPDGVYMPGVSWYYQAVLPRQIYDSDRWATGPDIC